MKFITSKLALGLFILGLSFNANAQSENTSSSTTGAVISAPEPDRGELSPPPGGLGGGLELGLSFNVYPNPGNGEMTISLPQADESAFVKVSDLLGRTYYQGFTSAGQAQIQLDLKHVPAGVYLVQVNERSMKYQKF